MRTLFGYLQKKKILQTSEEQSRLLLKVPDVIADEEVEDIEDHKSGDESSQISIPNGNMDITCHKCDDNGISSGTIY